MNDKHEAYSAPHQMTGAEKYLARMAGKKAFRRRLKAAQLAAMTK